MPSGVGADTLQSIPAPNHVVDPAKFFQLTERNVGTLISRSTPGAGQFFTEQVVKTGILGKLRLQFVGSLAVASAAVTSGVRWPHGLLEQFVLGANGQNDLISVDGLDLHTLRSLRYPAFTDRTSKFPGTVGGGDSIGVATHDLVLDYEVPVSWDDTTLIGALFAQSSSTNLTIRIAQALNTRLFSANPANATITGTWYVSSEWYEIPFDSEGNMVVPDVTRLHGLNAVETPFTNVGPVKTPLIRSEGDLHRLLISAHAAAETRLTAAPSAATSRRIDKLTVEYGGNQRPLVYEPAHLLLSRNNEHYGTTPTYDRHVIDLVRDNPQRDKIHLPGVTELKTELVVNSAVTVAAGSVRLVQETMF